MAVIHTSTTQTDIEASIHMLPFTCGYADTVEYRGPKQSASGAVSGRVLDEDRRKGVPGRAGPREQGQSEGRSLKCRIGQGRLVRLSGPRTGRYSIHAAKDGYHVSQIEGILVPRRNETVLELNIDRQGHMHVCQ